MKDMLSSTGNVKANVVEWSSGVPGCRTRTFQTMPLCWMLQLPKRACETGWTLTGISISLTKHSLLVWTRCDWTNALNSGRGTWGLLVSGVFLGRHKAPHAFLAASWHWRSGLNSAHSSIPGVIYSVYWPYQTPTPDRPQVASGITFFFHEPLAFIQD